MFSIDLIARDIMSSPVINVKTSMTIEEVSDLFSSRMISGAPVYDDDDKLVGVVSQNDIVRNEPRREHVISDKVATSYVFQPWQQDFDTEELNGFHLEEPETLTVKDIMTPFIYRVKQDTTAKQVADIMVSSRIHRLFVTDKNDKIIGIISALDILRVSIGARKLQAA